jgi:choline transport protein
VELGLTDELQLITIIALGSKTAFGDLAGSFIILSTASYVLAIAPHVLTGRKNVPPGWFWMGKYGYVVNFIAVLLTIFFDIFFCFRSVFHLTLNELNDS